LCAKFLAHACVKVRMRLHVHFDPKSIVCVCVCVCVCARARARKQGLKATRLPLETSRILETLRTRQTLPNSLGNDSLLVCFGHEIMCCLDNGIRSDLTGQCSNCNRVPCKRFMPHYSRALRLALHMHTFTHSFQILILIMQVVPRYATHAV
jgi:hypothetical protein